MTDRARIDFKQVAAEALGAADRLVPQWLPGGRREGSEWKARNPVRNDERLGSFSVNLKSGVWSDFATGDKGGDLISLYAYLFEGGSQARAARKLAEDLRISPAPAQQSSPPPAEKARTQWVPVTPVPVSAPLPPKAHPHRGLPAKTWMYRDADGRSLGYVYRFETSDGGKDLIPLVWARHAKSGKAEWRWQQWAVPRPLYLPLGLSEDAARTALVVEGEKCADVAQLHLADPGGFEVVSWPGGGKAVSKVDWSPLAGRQVIIWPDCDSQRFGKNHPRAGELMPAEDQPGAKAAAAIAAELVKLGCSVEIVEIPGPGERKNGWDVADAVEDGWPAERLLDFIANRKPFVAQSPDTPPDAQPPEPTKAARAGKKGGKPKAVRGSGAPWEGMLLERRGEIAPVLANVVQILTNHADWSGVIRENLFLARPYKCKPMPGIDGDEPGEWEDIDTSRTVIWLTDHYGMAPAGEIVDKAVDVVARANAWHPVRDWIDGLAWDGRGRIDHWLQDYLQVPDSQYARLVSRWYLIAMVARVFRPGVKFDTCLVLEGDQGRKKSSALRVLADPWFSDTELDLSSKDSMSSIRGKWLHEFGEMGSIARAEATRQKSFLSRQIDEFRPVYGRREVRAPRQLVFAGTTNEWQWQKDSTGGRRFWPVEVTGEVDADGLAKVREQLFAEAKRAFDDGERWWPTADEQREVFDPQQLAREAEDAFFEAIHDWLEESSLEEFTLHHVLTEALKLDAGRMTRDVQTRVGQQLKKLGCRRKERRNGVVRFVYLRPEWTPYQRSKRRAEVGDSDGAVPI